MLECSNEISQIYPSTKKFLFYAKRFREITLSKTTTADTVVEAYLYCKGHAVNICH